MGLPVLGSLSDCSFFSAADGARVSVIDAEVMITTEALARTGRYRLVTTLLDRPKPMRSN